MGKGKRDADSVDQERFCIVKKKRKKLFSSLPFLILPLLTKMSRLRVFALLAMVLVAQALAAETEAEAGAGEKAEPEPEPEKENPYGRSSHFNMEMYRLATVGIFLVVALILGVVVYKTCSWPRLE